MKLQNLAVIGIIIILPMAILLDAYSSNQIMTIQLQSSYDTKLTNATYDAIKAFQLNMSNSSTSDLANSKMRDIRASINTFYTSLSSNFNMSGYGKDILQNYVPTVVYTLYDGFYIHSNYENVLSDVEIKSGSKYDVDKLYGLKPYVYYSQRYKKGADNDFVITYSLDSYITIQGKVKGEYVNESGYILSGVTYGSKKITDSNVTLPSDDLSKEVKYRKNIIDSETSGSGLNQYIYEEGADKNADGTTVTIKADTNNNNIIESGETVKVGAINQYPYKKENGVKYYLDDKGDTDDGNDEVFSVINEEKYMQTNMTVDDITTNDLGRKYYMEAFEFTNKVLVDWKLKNLSTKDAVDIKGNEYVVSPYYEHDIFEYDDNLNIEDANSNFNGHRTEVIKNAVETTLIPAIASYSEISTSQVSFAMPKLTDYEWEQIANNITVISFMQGFNIGGKIYSGHAIVTNNNNEEFVSEDSIYILNKNNSTYYKVTDSIFDSNYNFSELVGVFNADFQRRMVDAVYSYPNKMDINRVDFTSTIYYYPRWDTASYTSIVNPNTGQDGEKTIDEYLVGKNDLAKIYYTALGREKMGIYRVHTTLK